MLVTVTQFSGGQTIYQSDRQQDIYGISKYLLALCGKYATTAEELLKPRISLVKGNYNYNFGNITYNTYSPVKEFDIIASNLQQVDITFGSSVLDFQVSYDGIYWGSFIDLKVKNNVNYYKLYVRFHPTSHGLINGDLNISCGSLNKTIYLSGTGY